MIKDKVYLNDDDYIDSIAQHDQTNTNKNFKMQTKDYHSTKVHKYHRDLKSAKFEVITV